MCQISIYEAKTQLSKYIGLLQNGEEETIVILKNGHPVAKITSFAPEKKPRPLGVGRELFGSHEFVLKDPEDHMEDLFGY